MSLSLCLFSTIELCFHGYIYKQGKLKKLSHTDNFRRCSYNPGYNKIMILKNVPLMSLNYRHECKATDKAFAICRSN